MFSKGGMATNGMGFCVILIHFILRGNGVGWESDSESLK